MSITRSLLLACLIAVTLGTAATAAVAPRYVRTPGGWTWSECVYELPASSHVIDLLDDGAMVQFPNGSSVALPPCARPFLRQSADPNWNGDYDDRITAERRVREPANSPRAKTANGWQAWTAYNNEANATFDAFLGFFDVPAAPLKFPSPHIGILYMFTGLQNDNWIPDYSNFSTPSEFDIIQPVLQYGGGSENGGGEYWGLASWYVTVSAGAVYSKTVKMNPGDKIFGNMTRTGSTTWYIAGVTPNGTVSDITVTRNRLLAQSWAYCTLEVYNINSCSYFPPASSQQHYTQLQLIANNQIVTPQWTAIQQPNSLCGSSMSVISPSSVTLTFQQFQMGGAPSLFNQQYTN